jgi:hypothetical protein
MRFISRGEADYRPDLRRLGQPVTPSLRTEIVHHHTVTIDADCSPNLWETVPEMLSMARRIQTCRPDLGLDVPYNVLIFCGPETVMVEGRGWDRTGAHTAGHNQSGFGFGWVGDFRTSLPDGWPRQMVDVADWCHTNLLPRFPNLADVYGHKDFKTTDCPGLVYAQLGLFRRVCWSLEDDMVIRVGMQGVAVRRFQQALRRWNPQALPRFGADGHYGGETVDWVSRFQTAMQIDVTGQIDGITAALLLEV